MYGAGTKVIAGSTVLGTTLGGNALIAAIGLEVALVAVLATVLLLLGIVCVAMLSRRGSRAQGRGGDPVLDGGRI